ncbi:MAG: HEAT repeat domain-containing protein [Ignavibacteriaceae bacterium]
MRVLVLIVILYSSVFSQVEIINPVKIHKTSFAIIIDRTTYKNCNEAVLNYRNAIEDDELSSYIVISDWKRPDEIKAEIIKLYDKKPKLEGVVFVGDIPIPMIRNAQHLTSAFKLEEDKYPWFRSSVPSDRFYDDFDLKFDYLMQDSLNQLSHYYSLRPDSPQKIEREIYSARIKPSGVNIDKYEIIRNYLNRIAIQKKKKEPIDNAMIFTGHGYHSESLASWGDERLSVIEQFPQLFSVGKRIKFINHSMGDDLKEILMVELMNKDLDIALFHAHGDTDMQLLLSYPLAGNITQNVEGIKLFLRSKMRTAQRRKQSLEETKAYYQKEYDIPDSWFEGTFGDSLIAADSILNYKLDMYLEDIRKMMPEPKFVMFDQCFNGSFHLDEYVTGDYVFGKGNVIVGEGNSVNCLQDKWANEHLGLLNLGVRVGNRHRFINLLENHLIGDPTYRFDSNLDYDLNEKIVLERENTEYWKKLLNDKNDEIRSLAIRLLHNIQGDKWSKELLQIYLSDLSINVRLQALKCLAELNDDTFRDVLKVSINDPFEYIRRKSADWMGEIGELEYLPVLMDPLFYDESVRVSFNVRNSLTFINSREADKILEKYIGDLPYFVSKKEILSVNKASLNRSNIWLFEELIPHIQSDTLKEKTKLQEIRTFRNYKFSEGIPFLLSELKNPKQSLNARVYIAEALGWYSFHKLSGEIIKTINELLMEKNLESKLKDELLRTRNRFLAGHNDVMLP